MENNAVTLTTPAIGNSPCQTVTGTWSMMYDQGFVVETNLFRAYANFKYSLKPEYTTPDLISKLESGSYEAFNSECDKTMIGFVQFKNSSLISCFIG